jgi:hypothetical protein
MKNEAVDALERQRHKTMQAREEARKSQEDLAIAQVCWPTSSSPCCRENVLLVRDIDTLDIRLLILVVSAATTCSSAGR